MNRISDDVLRVQRKNGLTVLIKENHSAPVVAIYTYVKTGYFHEPDDLVGISHVIEHMFFKGTRKHGVGQIARETKALGGYLNASTSYEHTLYYAVLPARNFSSGLHIQADALLNSAFKTDELQKEIAVIIQEAKRKLDTPSAVAREKLFELAFTKHRMRRWRIGTEKSLLALTRDTVVDYYRKHYRPQNIILTVVGDIDRKSALREIESAYGGLGQGPLAPAESPSEPPQKEFRFGRQTGDLKRSFLALGFHTPGILHEDAYALEILSFILGYGRSSRLYRKVKEETGHADAVTAYQYSLASIGMFMVEAIAAADRLHEAEQGIFTALRRVKETAVSENELVKARNLLEAMYYNNMESMAGQASVLSTYEALGDYRLVESYLEQLYRVGAGDILQVAQKYLVPENGSLFEYVPTEALERMAKKAEIVSRLSSELKRSGRAEHFSATAAQPPGFPALAVKAGTVGAKAMRKMELDNGICVLLKESHATPHIAFGVYARGSRSMERQENAGISWLTARTAMKGTSKRSAADIATEIENLGSSIQFSTYADYFAVSMKILSRHFRSGLDILSDVVLHPTFPDEEFEKEKAEARSQLARLQDDMFRYPLQLYFKAMFGELAYGLPVYGTDKTLATFDRRDLVAWYRKHFTAGNLLIAAVGDFDSQEIMPLLNETFGSLQRRPRKAAVAPALGTSPVHKLVVEERKRNQSAMVVGFPGPGYDSHDKYALIVLQNIVSGLGGRFFEELRGRQSLAYTVSAQVIARALGGTFFSYIATSPQNESKARQHLAKEFQKLTQAPVTPEEHRRAVRYTIGVHDISMERIGSQLNEYAHAELLGAGFGDVDRYAQKIAGVKREAILQTARACFVPERLTEAILRGTGE